MVYLCYTIFLKAKGDLIGGKKIWLCFFGVNILLILVEGVFFTRRKIIREVNSKYFAAYSLVVAIISMCIIEIICYSPKAFMSLGITVLNVGILWLLLFGIVIVFANHIMVYIGWLTLCWLFSVVCYFIYQFRGMPLSPSDLIAFRTGLDVAAGYSYQMNAYISFGTIALIGSFLLIILFPPKRFEKRNLRNVVAGVCVLTMTGIMFCKIDIDKLTGIDVSWWERTERIKELGTVAAFVEEMQKLTFEKPEGYSATECKKVLEGYATDNNNADTPNVIVIMNESFSDLSVLGDFESEEYLHNFNIIDDYVQKGYLYMSVFGAQTCNSEYEFLTGSSMAFASGNLYMYCDLSKTNSVVNVLENQGYSTLAYHPGERTAWNRHIIYSEIGFDDFFAKDEMQDYVTVKGQVSDKTDYEYLIDLIDENDKPLFLFNVTMQNHGGYDFSVLEDYVEPIEMGEGLEDYTEARTFLTGMRESDIAFYDLLEYFRDLDEKTVVVIFGDHQPSLTDGFTDMLLPWDGTIERDERLYITPYMIWANYDMGVEQTKKDMSANYLSSNLLDLLGMKDEYASYLLDLESRMPVINSLGYQTNDGVWHDIGEENTDIDNYKKLWYYENFEYRK